MKVREKSLIKNQKLAKTLAKKNGGKLPSVWRLVQLGHSSLYKYMRRHPKEFANVEIEFGVKTEISGNKKINYNVAIRKEHLQTAKILTRRNRGKFPSHQWLQDHEYTRLAEYSRKFPKLFLNTVKKSAK